MLITLHVIITLEQCVKLVNDMLKGARDNLFLTKKRSTSYFLFEFFYLSTPITKGNTNTKNNCDCVTIRFTIKAYRT